MHGIDLVLNGLGKRQLHVTAPSEACIAGFQLVDGKERIIVVEGLADGAMQGVEGIALASLDGSITQPASTRLRAVHWHTHVRCVYLCVCPFVLI